MAALDDALRKAVEHQRLAREAIKRESERQASEDEEARSVETTGGERTP